MSSQRKDSKGRTLRSGEAQLASGRYMYRYTDRAGKRMTVYSWKLVETDRLKEGQRGKKSLREKEKEIQRDLDDGIKTDEAIKTTLEDMFHRFLEVRIDLRDTTRQCYKELFQTHVLPVLGHKPLGAIKQSDIQKMYQSAVSERGIRASTVQKVHTIVYQCFEMAVADNIIRYNPSSNVFKYFSKSNDISSKKRDALTIEQQNRFIDFVYANRIYRRLGNLFTVMLGTGMRIGEALALTWDDVDFENGTINVYKTMAYKRGDNGKYGYILSPPKTPAAVREIPMLDDVKKAFLLEKKKGTTKGKFKVGQYSGFIFLNSSGQVYTNAFLYDSIQGIVETYNREELAKSKEEKRLPVYLPKISTHIFRHTFCTRMCEQGMNLKVLQDIMGHRNIRTTMEIYSTATREKKQEAIKEMNGKIKIA